MEKELGKFSQRRKQKEGVTNTDMNIGPEMGKRIVAPEAPEIGKFKEGVDEVKAEMQQRPSKIADNLQKRNIVRKAKEESEDYKKGGMVKSSASSRADGCAVRGKTKGRIL